MYDSRIPAGLKTSEEWLTYFRSNLSQLRSIPWGCGYLLTDSARDDISHSIRIFQLGESSEGTHFMKAAREYAAGSKDALYPQALRLFIAEEQRHARHLARFMTQQEIPVATRQWTDTLFRRLRKLLNLEVCIVVLVTAEVIARVYYRALRNATHSPILRSICAQILRDETMHVRFQMGTLATMRMDRPAWVSACLQSLHSILFFATVLVVWQDHRRLFRAGGYSFRRFWNRCWLTYRCAQRFAHRAAEVQKALRTLRWRKESIPNLSTVCLEELDTLRPCTQHEMVHHGDLLMDLRRKCEKITVELQGIVSQIAEMEG